MKQDPYKNERIYQKWKRAIADDDIPEISKANSNLIKQFLKDMEIGMNIAPGSKKGARGFGRLRALKDKLMFFSRNFKEHLKIDDITKINEEQLHFFFANMRNGTLKKKDGEAYMAVHHFAKIFKAFWHWHMKIQKKKGKLIHDISTDLDTTGDKPKWVYLSEKDVKKICDNATYEYKVFIMLLFDSGIRAPTELSNVRVCDFHENFKKLVISEEVSKTFGRKINLMLCSELIKEYIETKGLSDEDYLFKIIPQVVNKYLKRLAVRVLGDKKTLAGDPYSKLSMYDFRHSSACYWLPRYKSESAMKYRFGWKKSDMIHYYTEFLGMKDTIAEEDMFVDVTKTDIEQKLIKSDKERELMKEEMADIRNEMAKIMQFVKNWDKEIVESC